MATATLHVATQEVFSHSYLDGESETWNVPANTAAHTLVVEGTRYGVTLTNTADIAGNVKSRTFGRLTVSLAKAGGVGNDRVTAVVAPAVGVTTKGTWEFAGVVSSGSTAVPTTTPQSTPVYVTSGGALTLASSGNTRVGVVNYPAIYVKVAGILPVKIGA